MCYRRVLPAAWVLVIALWVVPAQAIPDWTFGTLPPDGAIAGEAGSTIGWGYTISNLDDSNWLLLGSLDADVFLFATPDASPFDYPSIAPGGTVSVPYDGLSGLFQLTWDAGAPVGFLNTGLFTAGADWYDGDPFGGGLFLDMAGSRSTAYSAEVTASVSLPEPSTFLLLMVGGAVLVLVRTYGPRRLSNR